VDLALTFYSLAALYALLAWLYPKGESSQPSGWLVLAGVFGGACLSIKYTGGVTLLILGAVLLWSLIRRHLTLRHALLGGLVVGGLSLAVAAPWYLKNAIVAGNPVYPLVWGGHEWNEIDTRWLLAIGQEMSVLDLLIVPWTLTVVGQQGTAAYDATYSPLFLMLLPLLLIVRRKAPGLGALLIAAGMGYGTWIVSGAAAYGTFVLRGRQLLPIFAPLSLLCAYSLDRMELWDRPSFSLQRVLKIITGLTLGFGLLSHVLLATSLNPWPYLVGQQSREHYLESYVPQRLQQTFGYLNENLDPDDKVLFVWELRSYGLEIPHQADILLNNFAQSLARYGSPEGVADGLAEEGFTHILVNQYIYPWITSDYPLTSEEQANWESFQARYLTTDTLVHAEDEYLELYRLVPEQGK
jgi:hypothetical protein